MLVPNFSNPELGTKEMLVPNFSYPQSEIGQSSSSNSAIKLSCLPASFVMMVGRSL
jgi:hypothetical protein